CWWESSRDSLMVHNVVVGDFSLLPFADIVNDLVASVNVTFNASNYPTLAAIFKEPYGPPTQIESQSWTTQGGVTLPGQIMLWRGKKVSITIQERGGFSRID